MKLLFYVFLLSLSFSDLPIFGIASVEGGIFQQASTFFALTVTAAYLLTSHFKIQLGHPISPSLLIFCLLLWSLFSSGINLYSVDSTVIQNQTRTFRFVSQFFTMAFGFFFSLIVANVYLHYRIQQGFTKFIIISLFISLFVATLQAFAFLFDADIARTLLKPIYVLFRSSEVPEGIGRVSGLFPEPSLFALFICTAAISFPF